MLGKAPERLRFPFPRGLFRGRRGLDPHSGPWEVPISSILHRPRLKLRERKPPAPNGPVRDRRSPTHPTHEQCSSRRSGGDRCTVRWGHRQVGSWSSLLSDPEQVSTLPEPRFPHLTEAFGRSFREFYHRESGGGWAGRRVWVSPATWPGSGYRAGARMARSSRPCHSRHRSYRARTWSPWPSTAAVAPGR